MESHPWTNNQVTLAMVAIFLAICCLIILTINQLHNHIIAQASEDLVTHLLFALGANQNSSEPRTMPRRSYRCSQGEATRACQSAGTELVGSLACAAPEWLHAAATAATTRRCIVARVDRRPFGGRHDPRRQDVNTSRREGRLGESEILARRPEARDGDHGRQAARYLGVRLGARHAHATDVRCGERSIPRVDAGWQADRVRSIGRNRASSISTGSTRTAQASRHD